MTQLAQAELDRAAGQLAQSLRHQLIHDTKAISDDSGERIYLMMYVAEHLIISMLSATGAVDTPEMRKAHQAFKMLIAAHLI